METIHKRIRRLRDAAGLTQKQLAAAAGVSYQSVQEWETEGGTAPARKRQGAVAAALKVTVHELMTGETPQVASPEELAPREEIMLQLFRGLFTLQQRELIAEMRALFDANQITRKELGQQPLRGVPNEAVERAFGKVPAPKVKATHGRHKGHPGPATTEGE